jgi:hypothetical protein
VVTEVDLISALRGSGFELKPRVITDWIAKGLLPKRSSPGRGKGKGRVYYWDDDSVIEQARTLCRLRTVARSFRKIYIPFVSFGYPVSANRLRQPLAEWLARAGGEIPDEDMSPEALAEWIGWESSRSRRSKLREFVDLDAAHKNLFLNPGHVPTEAELATLSFMDANLDTGEWTRFLREYVSYPVMRDALATASDEELDTAVRDWIVAYRRFKPFFEHVPSVLGNESWVLWLALGHGITPRFLLGDIAYRRAGNGARLDALARREDVTNTDQ